MAKQQQRGARRGGEKVGVSVGKGKVTPVQVAFIVERYLADNNYRNALSAFRSEAADLFSKTKGKEVPKGLLGLGEILEEYIGLKEQKMVLQQEKMRIEKAMHSFQDLCRAYFSSPTTTTTTTTTLPSSPPFLIPPLFLAPPHTASSPPLPPPPQGTTNPSASNPVSNFSTPITSSSYPDASYHSKRKASKSLLDAPPPAPKKSCIQPSSLPSSSSKIVSITSNMQEKMELINNSIAKNLFKPAHSISNASPRTPQPESPSTNKPTSKCSIVSSERIIVSPLKGGAAYYSVERSYQFTSPLKADGRKPGKRDHVKGKLNFDNTDANAGPSEAVTGRNDDKVLASPSTYSPSTSSPEGGENENRAGDGLDFDFSEFDILNGDFSFSELLMDLDLDCDEVQSSPEQTNSIPRLNSELEEGESSPDASKLPISDSRDANILGGHETVTSIRAITKRVKILSPVKSMRNQ